MLKNLKTALLGRSLELLETVDSTSKYIKERAQLLENGFVAIAKTQTGGRGRLGRTWQSPEGCLYMSVLIKNMPLQTIGAVPLVGGLAAAKALGRLTGAEFGIKWPNDVVCGGKKIAGLLAETAPVGSCVLGVGINLNLEQNYYEEAGLLHAGSVFSATGKKIELFETAAAFLNELEPLINEIRARGFAPLREQYISRCISLGKRIRIINGETSVEAFGKDIADDGALIAVFDDQSEKKVYSGEVSVRGLEGYV